MEHLAFFNLGNDPFRNDPSLDHFFSGSPQRSALRRLLRLVQQRKELSLLTGATGVGKTTLLRSFFEDLDPEAFEPALIVVSRGVEPEWLRRSLAAQVGVETPSTDRAEGMRELYQCLVEVHQAGRRSLALIDEAQALDPTGLAELRSWMNLEFEEQKLLSFVLAGDRALEGVLAAEMGLLDRVEAQVDLRPFSQKGSREYLEHRLKRAGGHTGIFEDDAYAAIADLAGGIPRRLNALADNALFEAYLAGRSPAGVEDVVRAGSDLPWARPSAGASEELAAGELHSPNDDSLDDVAAAFGPVALREIDSMGVSATNPNLGAIAVEGLASPESAERVATADETDEEDSSSLFGLDDSIGGAFAMMTQDDEAILGPEAPVEEDAVEIPEDFGEELLAREAPPELDPASPPVLETTPEATRPPPAERDAEREPAASAESPPTPRAILPEEDEIEGLFENLVQDD